MTILSKVTTLQHQLKDSSLCGDEISLRIPQAGEGETSSLIPDNSRDLQYEELIQRLNPEKDPLGPLHLSGKTDSVVISGSTDIGIRSHSEIP